MSTETKTQLRQCLDLLAKIRGEYQNGEFDREMIHGEMDFRFKRIEELRDKIETLPKPVHEFARFIDTTQVSEKMVTELETSAGNINELLTRTRLAGILDDDYKLTNEAIIK